MYSTYAVLIDVDDPNPYRYLVPSTREEHVDRIMGWTGLSTDEANELHDFRNAHGFHLAVYTKDYDSYVSNKGVQVRLIDEDRRGVRKLLYIDLINYNNLYSNWEDHVGPPWAEESLYCFYSVMPPEIGFPAIYGEAWEIKLHGHEPQSAIVSKSDTGVREFLLSDKESVPVFSTIVEEGVVLRDA